MKIRDYIRPIVTTTIVAGAFLFVSTANAGMVTAFNGWNVLAADDGVGNNGFVDPGWGGQAFDAEYLVYQLDGNTLKIGLQTGFNIIDGSQVHGGKTYYAGDLGLSFDTNDDTYEYAYDAGKETKNKDGDNVEADADASAGDGKDAEGIYKVTRWNEGINFDVSNPFAMDDGAIESSAFVDSGFGSEAISGELSYFRWVQLDLIEILGGNWDTFTLSAHWTMSCGNDAIEGSADVAPVPEPATMLLFGTGLAGLAGLRSRKKKK